MIWFGNTCKLMADLSRLFKALQKDKQSFLTAAKGGEFEERLKVKLDEIGFNRITKEDIIKKDIIKIGFVELKKLVQEAQSPTEIGNPTNYRRHYLVQPFGSQRYPDFLVFDAEKVVSIESKYSQKSEGKPMWNGGLPRPGGIYIFGAYGRRDVTFFRGCDVVSPSESRKLIKFFNRQRKAQEEFNKQHMQGQKYGFVVYVRKAFEQRLLYNNEAVTNFFTNERRAELERLVIGYTAR